MTTKFKYLLFFLIGFIGFLSSQLISFLAAKGGVFIYKNEKIIPLFLFLALIAFIIFSLLEIKKEANYPLLISLGLILAGGLSNLFDCLRIGGVADYLDMYFLKMNLADIFILVGVIIFFWLKLANMKKV